MGKRRLRPRRAISGLIIALAIAFIGANVFEWRTNLRVLPWDAYAGCGESTPASLPDKVHIGLYEEFPTPERLDKLRLVDFPVTLAVAAKTRTEFLALRDQIQTKYPQVRQVVFWPVLTEDEGYYPGAWSDADGVARVAAAAEDLPVLWDSEVPPARLFLSFSNWWRNRTLLDQWLKKRTLPVHIWRTNRQMGLNPLFLRLVAMHFDPSEYPSVSLQIDLYTRGDGLPDNEFKQVVRCGVEQYGARFIPALGVLNDGLGPAEIFVPVATLKKELALVRSAGVSEIWLFGVNGLNASYIEAIYAELPLERLP